MAENNNHSISNIRLFSVVFFGIEDSNAGPEASNSSDEFYFVIIIILLAARGGDHPPQDFLSLLENDNKSGQAPQSFDLREELGIVVILPCEFTMADMDIKPYHTIPSPNKEETRAFIPFAPNGNVAWESADGALVVEVRDPPKFLDSTKDLDTRPLRMLQDLFNGWKASYVKQEPL